MTEKINGERNFLDNVKSAFISNYKNSTFGIQGFLQYNFYSFDMVLVPDRVQKFLILFPKLQYFRDNLWDRKNNF